MSEYIWKTIDEIDDETLKELISDDMLQDITRKIFINFTSDWLLGKHFYFDKIHTYKAKFWYDIEIDLDDYREHLADCKFKYDTEFKEVVEIH